MPQIPQAVLERIEAVKSKKREVLSLSHIGLKDEELPEVFSLVAELPHVRALELRGNDLSRLPSRAPGFKNLSSLDLSRNKLKEVPAWLGDMHGLTELDLSLNSLERLPDELRALRRLKDLTLSGNPLERVPAWLGELGELRVLELSNISLRKLPDQIRGLRQLTSLSVSSMSLDSVPAWLGELRELTELKLSGNGLTDLPGELRALSRLESLDVAFNNFKEWPAVLWELRSLKTLRLSGTRVGSLPSGMLELTNLTRLTATHCDLTSLPAWIGQMRSLTSLDVSGNSLEALPDELRRLSGLTSLDVGNNLFTAVPPVIYELTSLESLRLDNYFTTANQNEIRELSPDILRLKNLFSIMVSGNPLVTPPIDIAEKGVESIKRFFSQLEEEGVDYLYEAKILTVGEPGAGKTSLAKKIVDADYKLRDDEVSTKGIEVLRWYFQAPGGERFRANIWDFGGQEIYHATHQFFLTKRSLYLLVADTRKEDTDFHFWLNAVSLLSENSPLLIVKNEKQDRHRDINERQLRGQFTNLKETVAVNLATNRGLPELLNHIRHHLTHLEHIGSPLPKSWVKVREALENDPRNYISLEEYLSLCDQHGFREMKNKLQLSDYLHDLGVCLHFQRDPLLNKTVILKPKWGTDAVYKVLDNKKVISNQGRFNRADLAEIWHEDEYAEMRDELLQLMVNFQLCYRIPDSEDYIAPQLLTENQPHYDWDEENNLLLRYSYPEFMPKGILTRFIVVSHRWIDRQTVWRSGVILEREATRAEVIEHYSRREIRIRISGRYKKDLMTIVSYELGKIHDRFKELEYDQLIPCNCEVCKNNPAPYFYPFEDLKRYLIARRDTIECRNSYQSVNVRGLIDDFADERELLRKEKDKDKAERQNVYNINGVESLVIQQTESGDIMTTPKQGGGAPRSPWASGSFYLFAFAVVIAGLGVLARSVPPLVLPALLVAGAVFVPMIGALQLKNDDKLKDKPFLELMKLTVGQLPLIRNLGKAKP